MPHGYPKDEGIHESTYTVRLFDPAVSYNGCTDIDSSDNELSFVDYSGKLHRIFGAKCEVIEE
jgi:hypothetical protein